MNKISVITDNTPTGFNITIYGRGKEIVCVTSEQMKDNIEVVSVLGAMIELGNKHGADTLAESLGLIWDNGWVLFEEHYPSVSDVLKTADKDGYVDFSQIDPRLRKLADHLHHQFCYANHTDGCGYEYETWKKVNIKREYPYKIESLTRALRLLAKFNNNFDEVYETLKMYKEIPYKEVISVLSLLID